MSDAVNKPAHYNQGSIECIEAMKIVLTPEEFRGYLKGNVFKYLWREKDKNGIEDLKKAKWYLDRLIDSFDESIAEANETPIEPTRTSKRQPPAGYRLLGPAKDEPRIEGDSYWSLAIEEWIVLPSYKVEYANRDNWAACRRVEPVVKQSLTPKPSDGLRFRDWPSDSQEFSTPEPPGGWRWLEVGEAIRDGDVPFENGEVYELEPVKIGMTLQPHWKPIIRRNRFEVGEKVVHVPSKVILQVVDVADRVRVVDVCGSVSYYLPEVLAPYIEDAK
jgi:hypothetical protein